MIDWLVLTGGRSSRLGADKASTVLAGRSLLDRAVHGLRDADPSARVRAVGPEKAGGPAAAVVCSLADLSGSFVGVLAVDMPFAVDAIRGLTSAVHDAPADGVDAWVPVDAEERPQWLCAIYRRRALADAARGREDWRDAPFHALVDGLTVAYVRVGSATSLLDIDTPEDLRRATALAEGPPRADDR